MFYTQNSRAPQIRKQESISPDDFCSYLSSASEDIRQHACIMLPQRWPQAIINENGRPDYAAAYILAYMAEKTRKSVQRKGSASGFFPMRTGELAELFCCSRRSIERCAKVLRDYGLIYPAGRTRARRGKSYICYAIDAEALWSITRSPDDEKPQELLDIIRRQKSEPPNEFANVRGVELVMGKIGVPIARSLVSVVHTGKGNPDYPFITLQSWLMWLYSPYAHYDEDGHRQDCRHFQGLDYHLYYPKLAQLVGRSASSLRAMMAKLEKAGVLRRLTSWTHIKLEGIRRHIGLVFSLPSRQEAAISTSGGEERAKKQSKAVPKTIGAELDSMAGEAGLFRQRRDLMPKLERLAAKKMEQYGLTEQELKDCYRLYLETPSLCLSDGSKLRFAAKWLESPAGLKQTLAFRQEQAAKDARARDQKALESMPVEEKIRTAEYRKTSDGSWIYRFHVGAVMTAWDFVMGCEPDDQLKSVMGRLRAQYGI